MAEDLTASTFERVVRSWAKYDAARASERTWILSIARNALTDHFRRQSHRNATSLDEYPLLIESFPRGEDEFSKRLAVHAFADWLRDLPPRDKQVLALRYGADLSAAEIGRLMDLTEGNVHQIVSRTLKRLRTKADASEHEPPA